MKPVNHVRLAKLVYASLWSAAEREQLKFIVPKQLPDYAALPQPGNLVSSPRTSSDSESLVLPLNLKADERPSSHNHNATMLDYVWFKFVRLMYWFTDWLLRVVFRYSLSKGWHSERKQGAHFDNCAHVTRVLMKGRKIELEGARINNFILR